MVSSVPRVELRPDYVISRIIKGGWQLAGDHGPVDADRVVKDMAAFVEAGVTTFDCADIYTGVEKLIGRFLSDFARPLGTETVNRVKIHTKFVPDRDALATLSHRDVEAGIDRSLKRLGLETLDLVQFHWWNYDVPGYVDAVGHLDSLRKKGKINLIGVTNFDADRLEELCGAVDIASAQVQYSLLDSRASGDFARKAKDNGVSLLAYGVLAGGFLTDAWIGMPDPGFDLENRSLVKYRLIIEEFGGWTLFQELLSALRMIADIHGADVATIAVRATLDSADVAAAIVGARYANRLPHTLRAFEITLTDQDRIALDNVLLRRAGPSGPVYGLERDTSGRHGRIMKYNLNKGDNSLLERAKSDSGAD